MRAGNLRHMASFQANVSASDGMGGVITSWVTQFTQRARIKPVRGNERVEAGALTARAIFTVIVRASAQARTVSEGWRVVIDGVDYNIRSIINPDERNKSLEMLIESGVAT